MPSIFIAALNHAFRFMTAMHKVGLAAPRDYAILGYNDSDEARFTDPPLSSMAPRFEDIAGSMIDSALALGDGGANRSATGPGLRLTVRRSCGGADGMPAAMETTMHELGIEIRHDPERKPMPA